MGDITLTAESEEELKRFLMRVKEESENAGLKLNIKITKIMVLSFLYSTAHTSIHDYWKKRSLD